jgi:hypothetical protein
MDTILLRTQYQTHRINNKFGKLKQLREIAEYY